MANLTIKVSEDTLERARVEAVRQGTTLERVIVGFLRKYADRDKRSRKALAAFLEGARSSRYESSDDVRSREELHIREVRFRP